jgi:hypothetical protein
MIRQFTTLFAIVAFASASFAEVTAVSNAEKVCDQQCAKSCGSCPIETAMEKLPKLTYLVGTEETCCAEAAAKLATEHKTAIKYVVATKTFDDQAKATAALADATEQFVSAFTTTKECAVSGKFTVAGKEMCCSAMAGERATLAKHAMEKVAMAYVVGDEQCACPNQAAALAKSTGKDKVFLVAGEKTCCATDARLKLARAKYKAAVEALAKADAPSTSEKL